MPETNSPLAADLKKQEQTVKLRPTLFIAVGGTGMEVLLRVRRRILSATWGQAQPVRVETLPEFPVAQFMHFDLDQGAIVESGKTSADPLHELVKFSDEERIVENFDIGRYSESDDDLARFPHISSWSPLTPKKIRELGIDPAKGAGQIRGVARLYFFDKYEKVRNKIRNKLTSLKAGLSKEEQLQKLGLELDSAKFRIVVVGSIAGGTGGGSFLDMGWLAKKQASDVLAASETELYVFLPTGFAGANKDRTEANAYASLMELESCMRGGVDFVKRWDEFEGDVRLAAKPYDEVFLIDSGNMAQQHTLDIKDVYDMVADTLFEDFASADFARKKRSIAVNQRQHKISPFSPPVPENRFGEMKLMFHKGYSAFGQATLDTQQSAREDLRSYQWAGEMLKAFFGVGADNSANNRATDKQREEFMANNMGLKTVAFNDFPQFSAKVDAKLTATEFLEVGLVETLLGDAQGSLLAGLQQKVDAQCESIAVTLDRADWPAQVRTVIKQLERDAVRDQDSSADTTEDRVTRQRAVVSKKIQADIETQLYSYLDNKEFGGLEYVLSLVELIKDKLDNNATGVARMVAQNAERYAALRDALRTYEVERLLGNLEETKGSAIFSNKDKQAREVLNQLKLEIGNYLKFHIRAKAAEETARLLSELSAFLGDKKGVDSKGNNVWTGLVGRLYAGRTAVFEILGEINQQSRIVQDEMKREHATYIKIEGAEMPVNRPSSATLRTWADEAFKDFGGSRKLFPMLADPKLRSALIGPLRRKADKHLAQNFAATMQSTTNWQDPLVTALQAMSPVERQRRFSEMLTRSMPWIDTHNADYQPKPDQFKCYVGVGRAADWEPFREELFAQLPTGVGLTPQQISFVDAGRYGRATCYCELSGVPLTNLRGLESWRVSYRKESEIVPLHTQNDFTKFSHPLAPSIDELMRLSDDFKVYLYCVMLRIFTRDPSLKSVPPGQYQFSVGRGDIRRMGNERAFRLNGLPIAYRAQIVAALQSKLEEMTPLQTLALAELATQLSVQTYCPKLVPDESGTEIARRGFATTVALQLANELHDKAARSMDAGTLKQSESALNTKLSSWSEAIEKSEADAYAWEVREVDEGQVPRRKLCVKAEFFLADFLQQTIAGSATATAASTTAAGTPPPFAAPPPPPFGAQPVYSYHLFVNSSQTGPHPAAHIQQWLAAKQIPADTMAWRDGLAAWTPLLQLPEFAAMGAAPPPFMPPPKST